MITVVTHLWRQQGYHTTFGPEHVNALAEMVQRWYSGPYRFAVVTDQPGPDRPKLWPSIEVHDLGSYLADVPNPSIRNGPSCYRRLRLFSREARVRFGERIVALDLDCVVTGELAPLWDRPEDLVLWRDPLFNDVRYNGSMMLLRAGARPDVWDRFHPTLSPKATREAKLLGSDQAWISHVVGDDAATWGRDDGVYSFRLMTEPRLRPGLYSGPLPDHVQLLPGNARIVFFHGRNNPWDDDVRSKYGWVRDHYPALS